MTNCNWMETQNLVISFDYSWFLAKNLAYDECWIMKFHYRNSSIRNFITQLTIYWPCPHGMCTPHFGNGVLNGAILLRLQTPLRNGNSCSDKKVDWFWRIILYITSTNLAKQFSHFICDKSEVMKKKLTGKPDKMGCKMDRNNFWSIQGVPTRSAPKQTLIRPSKKHF